MKQLPDIKEEPGMDQPGDAIAEQQGSEAGSREFSRCRDSHEAHQS